MEYLQILGQEVYDNNTDTNSNLLRIPKSNETKPEIKRFKPVDIDIAFARIEVGKTSEVTTQVSGPIATEKKAINVHIKTTFHLTIDSSVAVKAIKNNDIVIPAMEVSKSGRRP